MPFVPNVVGGPLSLVEQLSRGGLLPPVLEPQKRKAQQLAGLLRGL